MPIEYQQIEYIEGTGTQWIDTLLVSNLNNKIYFDVDFEVNSKDGTSANRNPIGSQEFDLNRYFLQVYNSKFYLFNAETYSNCERLRNNVRFYLGKLYVNGELKNNSVSYPSKRTDNIYLFKWGTAFSENKLYSCIFYDEEKTLRKFIPCYTKKDVIDVNGKNV